LTGGAMSNDNCITTYLLPSVPAKDHW